MSWATIRDRMDRRVVARLKDGHATYQGSGIPAEAEVIVERNLMMNGPDGLFRSEATGFSWRKCTIPAVTRGGIFLYGGCRYVVEEIVSDDGHMVTAACMESR